MLNIAVFASGNGSNFEAIANFWTNKFKIKFLFCDRKDAFVIKRAQNLKVPFVYLSILKEKDNFYHVLNGILEDNQIDLIILAGYLKILPSWFCNQWDKKIINIHPSLLPLYPGINSIDRSFYNGDSKFGITIHYVDGGVDTGEIIAQFEIERNTQDNLESITKKVHDLEHIHYPQVIECICKEREE